MHKTECVIVVAEQIEAFAHGIGSIEAVEVEIFIYFGVTPCEYSHGNAANLEVPIADLSSIVGKNTHKVTLIYSIVD